MGTGFARWWRTTTRTMVRGRSTTTATEVGGTAAFATAAVVVLQ